MATATSTLTNSHAEITIPIRLTYDEAELVRGAIDVVSSNYNRDDRRVLEMVMHRLNDQICDAAIKSIKSSKTPDITDTSLQDNPDFLEIL